MTATPTGFTRMYCVPRILDDEEMDGLIALARSHGLTAGTTSGGGNDPRIRRSQVMWLRRADGHEWLYERIWQQIEQMNQKVFGFDITEFNGAIQLARYDASDEGFYNWHMDNGDKNSGRKISFSVQLSHSDDYEGGDLELWYKMRGVPASRERGAIVAFPSFVMHRVTPVTKGERFSLVAWIIGPRWR